MTSLDPGVKQLYSWFLTAVVVCFVCLLLVFGLRFPIPRCNWPIASPCWATRFLGLCWPLGFPPLIAWIMLADTVLAITGWDLVYFEWLALHRSFGPNDPFSSGGTFLNFAAQKEFLTGLMRLPLILGSTASLNSRIFTFPLYGRASSGPLSWCLSIQLKKCP